jgi:hypothetical protein
MKNKLIKFAVDYSLFIMLFIIGSSFILILYKLNMVPYLSYKYYSGNITKKDIKGILGILLIIYGVVLYFVIKYKKNKCETLLKISEINDFLWNEDNLISFTKKIYLLYLNSLEYL